jgi:hypothetical protein
LEIQPLPATFYIPALAGMTYMEINSLNQEATMTAIAFDIPEDILAMREGLRAFS